VADAASGGLFTSTVLVVCVGSEALALGIVASWMMAVRVAVISGGVTDAMTGTGGVTPMGCSTTGLFPPMVSVGSKPGVFINPAGRLDSVITGSGGVTGMAGGLGGTTGAVPTETSGGTGFFEAANSGKVGAISSGSSCVSNVWMLSGR
jgi:hypothetical protein